MIKVLMWYSPMPIPLDRDLADRSRSAVWWQVVVGSSWHVPERVSCGLLRAP
ncbi:hypothetical protein [Zoogloea sp.]|uniref:hypothetical protein n=1 Tax=Zoogloea sp. TaxID=49181 RepID=UPI001D3425BA|nr:hypothetical protein [Zoogloea sp.]MBK6656616.1 hypothetical protein [Zoogloea sp.]